MKPAVLAVAALLAAALVIYRATRRYPVLIECERCGRYCTEDPNHPWYPGLHVCVVRGAA